MPIISAIQRTIIEADEFVSSSSDINLEIPLATGETISFTAERQFFTPRYISTNRSDILGLPTQSVVPYTSNLIPVVKIPVGLTAITSPQYYPVTVVSDVYKNIEVDTFFTELANDLELPESPEVESLREQRNQALETALALDDLNIAAAVGDLDAFNEANEAIDEGLASQIPTPTFDPDAVLDPEEAEQLAALDMVGLTEDIGDTDAASEFIDPAPEISEDELINRIPTVSGRINGTETVNKAIALLNTGIQEIEDSLPGGVDENGDCKRITVAKGKKGVLGVGKRSTRTVNRKDVAGRMKTIDDEIQKQNASDTPLTDYWIRKTGVTAFNNAKIALAQGRDNKNFKVDRIGTFLTPLYAIKYIVYAPKINESIDFDTFKGDSNNIAQRSTNYQPGTGFRLSIPLQELQKLYIPMSKADILIYLNAVKKPLQALLDKECD